MMKSKNFMFHHHHHQQQQSHLLQQQQYSSVVSGVEETMSNLTSPASGEASASNSETGAPISYQYYAPPPDPTLPQPPPLKKKRSLPGNPDPDAEVIALTPKTLMATNRFMCEICGKGFQRDQNLQLHRRGHNLPWKLKQRANKEMVRKKVYVCPEPGCVHHEPSRALGDLTGIKKHFCRKHGEKKWKCDKCSKRYAVQSDWKAHSKICGTREYRCDCGTLFSRRDSFITHRAFCDALAEESTRTNSLNNILSSSSSSAHHLINSLPPQFINTTQNLHQFTTPKKEEQIISSSNNNFGLIRQDHHIIPPWLAPNSCPPPPQPIHDHLSSSSLVFSNRRLGQDHHQFPQSFDQNPSPSPSTTTPPVPPYHSSATALLSTQQPNMSATALLQKAAQMGATMSKSLSFSSPLMSGGGGGTHQIKHQQETPHVYTGTANTTASSDHLGKTNDNGNNNGGGSGNFELSLSSNDEQMRISVGGYHRHIQQQAGLAPFVSNHSDNLVGFEAADHSSFEDAFGGILSSSSKKDDNIDNDLAGDGDTSNPVHVNLNSSAAGSHVGRRQEVRGGDGGLTRDFLGLRPLSESDILSIAGLGVGSCVSTSSSTHDQVPHKRPWQG